MPPVPARIPDVHVFSCPPHRGGHGKDHRRSTPAAAPNVCNRAQSRTLRRMVQESAVSIQPVQQVTTIIFIARQHTDENGLIYRDSFFFHHTVAQQFQFYQQQTYSRNSDGDTPYVGAKYRCGIKISRFSTNKSLYLANDIRQRRSYCVMRIRNPTLTVNLDFRVTGLSQTYCVRSWRVLIAIATFLFVQLCSCSVQLPFVQKKVRHC